MSDINVPSKLETTVPSEEDKINNIFPDVVGQRMALKRLKFIAEFQNKTGIFSPLMITGSRGSGKNKLSLSLAKTLKPTNSKDKHKNIIEVNCASIESEAEFFDQIVNRYISGGAEVSIILDEFHALSKTRLIDAFLSIWNIQDGYITKYLYGGVEYLFDISKVSWIILTSEPNEIPETLLSRLEIIQLEDLSVRDLSKIIQRNLGDISLEDGLAEKIASYGRGNGRESFKLSRRIKEYLSVNDKKELTAADWQDIKAQLNLREMGISNVEHKILRYLRDNGDSSLTKLSSGLQLTGAATRGAFERYLLANNLIAIETGRGRCITNAGRRLLELNPE